MLESAAQDALAHDVAPREPSEDFSALAIAVSQRGVWHKSVAGTTGADGTVAGEEARKAVQGSQREQLDCSVRRRQFSAHGVWPLPHSTQTPPQPWARGCPQNGVGHICLARVISKAQVKPLCEVQTGKAVEPGFGRTCLLQPRAAMRHGRHPSLHCQHLPPAPHPNAHKLAKTMGGEPGAPKP